jgi:hypothetical protein
MQISVFCFCLVTNLEKTTNWLSETVKETIQDKWNKIYGSEADTLKQKFHCCFSKSKGFEVMVEIHVY